MFEDTERNRGRYADIVRIGFKDKTDEELRTIKELCVVRLKTDWAAKVRFNHAIMELRKRHGVAS
tara:strand:+ start:339 stop:533 length:195 start_codon:yes stop_codon:yes gene_type:complete